MPTNEERREVANELRYTASHSLNGYGFQRSVEGIVFGTLGDRTWRKILERLADLIEPEQERTCRIEGIYSDEFAIYDHLTCGHVNLRRNHEAPSYCSTCGSKVVQE